MKVSGREGRRKNDGGRRKSEQYKGKEENGRKIEGMVPGK